MRAGALYAYTGHSAEICIGQEAKSVKAVAETDKLEWSFPESHPPGLLLPYPSH